MQLPGQRCPSLKQLSSGTPPGVVTSTGVHFTFRWIFHVSSLSTFTSVDRHTLRDPLLDQPPAPGAMAALPRVQHTRELRKSLGIKPRKRSHQAFLCSDLLEELCQLFVEQSGHRRRLHLWEFAEK